MHPMVFPVIPAIDVADGRLAVWSPDGPRPVDRHAGDPLEAARASAAAGARWVHVVDLDHAFRGTPLREGLFRAIAAEGLAVQASGGIADADTVARALDAGASRVVLGSAALVDERATSSMLATTPTGSILVGLEVHDGLVRARGRDDVSLELASTLGWLVAAGAPGFLVTAVARVGAQRGPDLPLIRRVVRAGRPVLAAGGIASLEDLRTLRDAGAAGAIVGSAALDGAIDLSAAIAWGIGAGP